MHIYLISLFVTLALMVASVPAAAVGSMSEAGCMIETRRHVRALLSRGADIDTRDRDGQTLLVHAVLCGNERGARALIAEGADVNAMDKSEIRVLDWTLSRNMDSDDRRMFDLLVSHGADVNATDGDGYPLLYSADGDAAKALIAAGANVNATEDSGRTPLHRAARLASPSTARILIAAGADVNATDDNGRTPLHWAVRGRKTGVGTVEVLLAAGANPSATDSEGCSPVDWAKTSANERAHGILAALVAAGGRPRCS